MMRMNLISGSNACCSFKLSCEASSFTNSIFNPTKGAEANERETHHTGPLRKKDRALPEILGRTCGISNHRRSSRWRQTRIRRVTKRQRRTHVPNFASQEKETPGWSKQFNGPTFLFIEVDDLNVLMNAMKGVSVELPERTTFYGAREIGYRDPGGHVVLFAEFKNAQKE